MKISCYQDLLKRAKTLMPASVKIILLGDPEGIRVAARGFIDTKLMKFARRELGWHYRIRIKNDFWIWRSGKGWCQVKDFHLGWGEVLLLRACFDP
ncbi:MAG: hypothetical protein QNJ54_36430 [Prochloraceae cyanobacterium]|nr:hypothetical protein [Prochloraceae cyanobacterium]